MRLINDHVVVTVPATSANLGPGYDSLGIALDLVDRAELWAIAGETYVEVSGVGKNEVPTDSTNLVAQAARQALDYLGAPQVGLHIKCRNRIPHRSGLGSSAAAIVSGIMLARGLAGEDSLSSEEVLQLATQIEGHPDNVAPAVYGGATVAWLEKETNKAKSLALTPPTELKCTVLTPPTGVQTSQARKVLPMQVPHWDAAFNVGRASALSLILAGVAPLEHLLDATEDELHQEYRRQVMPATMELVDYLRDQGLPAVISGAGPSVLVLDQLSVELIEQAQGAQWQVRVLDVHKEGATLRARRL
ncbi:MAG: homoserine kinase [Actinomycetaceae bacterium]|nr:homoserine kinase [Actinomycetaceae bacterium]